MAQWRAMLGVVTFELPDGAVPRTFTFELARHKATMEFNG